jgi:TIR domain-containing protein
LTSESERQFILLTSESSSDEESAEDYGKKYGEEDVYKQCYFLHDSPFPDAKNIAIVSTYVWDNLPSIAKFPKTDLGRRALQPYLLYSFATIALSRCIGVDLPFHTETRGCPLDYCDTVQEIDRFFEKGRLCKECERFLQSRRQEGKITLKQIDSVNEVLRIAADRPEEYDLFISHAWEDKDAIARDLYNALVERGLKVWFDEATLELGDSLRRKIDDGIARCGFGVVILSPHFLRKNWTQIELNGLVARETASGEKAILPIWHELDAETLRHYSYTLADRVAARSEEGVPALVDQILRVLKR